MAGTDQTKYRRWWVGRIGAIRVGRGRWRVAKFKLTDEVVDRQALEKGIGENEGSSCFTQKSLSLKQTQTQPVKTRVGHGWAEPASWVCCSVFESPNLQCLPCRCRVPICPLLTSGLTPLLALANQGL